MGGNRPRVSCSRFKVKDFRKIKSIHLVSKMNSKTTKDKPKMSGGKDREKIKSKVDEGRGRVSRKPDPLW